MKKRLTALLLALALCLGTILAAAAETQAAAFDSTAAMEASLEQETESEADSSLTEEAQAEESASLTEESASTAEVLTAAALPSASDPADGGTAEEADAADSSAPEVMQTAAAVRYLRAGTVYLPVGGSVSLLASGAALPEGAAFSSADSTAVTVSADGVAAGAAAGSAAVTLKSAAGETLDTVRVVCYQKGDYFTRDAYYVKIGGTKTPKTAIALPEGAVWSSGTPSHVSVSSAGKLTGKAVGRSTISLKLPDGTVLDTAEVYAFEPTSHSVTPEKAKSGKLHARTLKTTNKYKSRTYYLYKQQFDGKKHSYLSAHGCSVTAAADVLTGYGFTDVDPVWLQETYIPQVAEKLGIEVGNRLDDRKNGKTLGFYGIQQTLLSMGVAAEIKSAYGDIEGAAEDITVALSEGRPVILLINKADVKGYPKLCSTWHYLFLSGIDENGYVLNTCGSSANVQTTNGLNGKEAKVTVTDLLTRYHRSGKKQRKTDSDFFISTSKTGSLTYLECLSPEPGLAENAITARGKTLTISTKAQTFSLKASVKGGAGLHYQSDNKKITVDSKGNVTAAKNYAGKATITITSDETQLYQAARKKVTVKVNLARNTITARGKNLTISGKAQTFSLKASAKGGAPLHYQSDNKKITVDSKGNVTAAKNYAGKATITITSDATSFYRAAKKQVTVRVNRARNTISGKDQKTVTGGRAKKLSLGCSAKGKASLSYRSNSSKVKVSDKGVVTIPRGFVGKAVITVTSAKTSCYASASRKITVTVSPAGVKLTSCASQAGKKLTAKWKKNSAVSGYQLQYSTDAAFKNAKKVTLKGKSTTSRTLSGLKKAKTYYVRVRTWKRVSGQNYYSSWSDAKKATISK